MFVWHGEVYTDKVHIDLLKNEAKYVKKRCQAVVRSLANIPFKISRKEAARMMGRSLRQLYRNIKTLQRRRHIGSEIRI